MDIQQQKRAIRLGLIYAAILAGGLIYAAICIHTEFAIPCIFYELTGLKCIGCGISRMCLYLLRGDIVSAWLSNPAIMTLSPVFAAVAVNYSMRYVKNGRFDSSKWADVLCCISLGVLLLFGIARNLPQFL